MHSSRRWIAPVVLAAALLAGSVLATGPALAGGNGRATLTGTAPAWAKSTRAVGAVSTKTRISFSVVLPLRDSHSASQVAADVSNPASPNYGHYLTPAAFNARFAPSAAQVAKVRSFLSGQGIKVTSVAQGNSWVSASGTAAQINKAFGVTLRTYLWQGKKLKAPDRSVSVPTSVSAVIAGVTGLDDGSLLRTPGAEPVVPQPAARPVAKPAATAPKVQACSTYWNQHTQTLPTAYAATSFPTMICGYSPAQVRKAYGLSSGKTGLGVTVAILDPYASPTLAADANTYSQRMGEPAFKTGQFQEHLFKPFDETTECGQLGWYDEQTLDVEAVHAMAPGANIMYVGAQDCGDGLDTAINWIVQTDAASIVSDSWGMDGEDGLGTEYAVESKMFLQAKAEGIGFYFSSGDNGDNKLLQKTATAQPDYPASDANVTAVGGTSLGINANGSYGFETGWGTDVDKVNFGTTPATYASAVPGTFKFGAGGGTSKLVPQPSYQVGAVPDSLAQVNGSLRMRVVPDVAAVADPYTGFAVGETVNGIFTVDPFGGTSLACPLFAGLQALASQGRSVPIGFANPLLYSLPKAAFHDVTAPAHDIALASTDGSEIVTLGRDSSLTTTSGFDNITGRGSPIGPVLIVDESPHAWPKLPVAPPSTRHSIVAAVAAF